MKDITYLQIEPTTKCNFACIFCCRNKLEQRDMNIDLFKQVLEELQQIHHIHIQGEGEPLLHPDIIEMFQFARQKAYVLTTITNGSLLSKYYKALVDCEIDRIGISSETVDKDRLRKIRGGSLDAAIKGSKQVVQYKKDSGKLKPALGFEVALLKDNLSELKRISDLYRDLEMDGGISVQPLNTTPFYFDNYDDYLKEQILTDTENLYLAKEVEKINRSITVNELVNRSLSLRQPAMKEKDCPLLSSGLFVHSTGKVSFCCLIKSGENAFLGDLYHDQFSNIINERFKRLKKFALSGRCPEECKNCMRWQQ